MLLVIKLILYVPGLSCLSLWWYRRQAAEAVVAALVANPTKRQRQRHCLWCWKEKHPHVEYPSHLTSSIWAYKEALAITLLVLLVAVVRWSTKRVEKGLMYLF